MAVNKDGVYIAQDKDFQSIYGYWVYKGSPLEVDITDFINSKKITATQYMFSGGPSYGATAVKRVVLGENSVTNMYGMFNYSRATSLDLSCFDTSSVTDLGNMFSNSQASSLDLSSFDTSRVTNMGYMFYGSLATTGYARAQADADKFNSSSGKPSGLVFVATLSFGRLNNLKINSMSYKDSSGIIKQVQTLKYKDNLGNITKLK